METKYEEGMEKGMEKGKFEGIKEGMKEGIKEGIREVALRLKQLGMDMQSIMQATGLTESEIQAL